MFAKGSWAFAYISSSSKGDFLNIFKDRNAVFHESQYHASISCSSVVRKVSGINPYGSPRLDESVPKVAVTEATEEGNEGFSADIEDYRLAEELFAFWVVVNEWEDTQDINSIKEQRSYEMFHCPYKLLIKDEKRQVDDEVAEREGNIPSRKQFPVFVDFLKGVVAVGSASASDLAEVLYILDSMGVKSLQTQWAFTNAEWVNLFQTLYKDSKFLDQFSSRARDIAIHGKDSVEKLEDTQLEHIVKSYFSHTEIDRDTWIGMSSPAQVSVGPRASAINVSTNDNVTTLLEHADGCLEGVTLTVRHSDTEDTKVVYHDGFTLVCNVCSGINDADNGFALVRGYNFFDYDKGIRKDRGVKDLWAWWYLQMMDALENLSSLAYNVIGKGEGTNMPFVLVRENEETEEGQ